MTIEQFTNIYHTIVDRYSSTHARNSNNSRRSPFQPHLVDVTISADTGAITKVTFRDIYSVYLKQFINEDNNIVFEDNPNQTLQDQINNFFEVLENDPTD